MASIAIIGAGSWGTAMAFLLAEKGFKVRLWVHGERTYKALIKSRENIYYLPGIKLPSTIFPTKSFGEAIKGQRDIIIALPSHVYRDVLKQAFPYLTPSCHLISTTKGIENKTLLTMSGVSKEVLGDFPYTYIALSGPSFAKEVSQHLPTAITVASKSSKKTLYAQKLFAAPYFRAYTHHDVLGTELGGALKNIIAIAAGIGDGLNLGHNARAALITRGLAEITRLGIKLGAKAETFSGLSGLGDLVLTCTSPLSRNYTVGKRLGEGESLRKIVNSMYMIAEGIKTSKAAYLLSQRERIDMPITAKVYAILYQDKLPQQGLKELLNRSLKQEFY
jgi:glycerol-3-phosphate dehydrogenase (NAD(P)+)